MKITMKENKRTVYIPSDTYDPAVELAKEQGISLSTAIRLLLRMWLDGQVTPQVTTLTK